MKAVLAILLAAWLGCSVAAAAEPPPLVVAGDVPSLSLDGYLSVLDDPEGRLAPEAAAAAAFQPYDRPGIATGLRWFRFTVRRHDNAPDHWVLAFGEPDLQDVRIYVDGREIQLGRAIPSDLLPLAARQHVAALDLPVGRDLTVLLRLQSFHKIRFEDAALWRPSALMFHEARQSAQYGVLFGMLAVVVAVSLMFGLWLRDAAMLFYSLYVGTMLARGLTHSGVAALLLPGWGGDLNYWLGGGGLIVGVASFTLMWDRILDLRANFPRMHRLYVWIGGAVTLGLAGVTSPAFHLFAQAALLTMFLATLSSLILAALLIRRDPGQVVLKFYLAAFLPLVVAWGFEAAAVLSPQVPAYLGRASHSVATALHTAILSAALAYRLGRMRRRRREAEVALAGEQLARQRQRLFLDMATHEFKTPLAVIDSAAQMLNLHLPEAKPEVGDRIVTIRRAVKRLLNLIETCLTGERIETTSANLQPVDPAFLAGLAAERNTHDDLPPVLLQVPSGLPGCRADPDLLAIALDALIDNARRYGPGGHAVELAVAERNGSVLFLIQDRGPGIPEAEQERIFHKYFRGTTSSTSAGSGIGLHLVRTIADLHGGEVTYQPRKGGGAIFSLALPATKT